MQKSHWMLTAVVAVVLAAAIGFSAFTSTSSSAIESTATPDGKVGEIATLPQSMMKPDVGNSVLTIRQYGPAAYPDVYAGVDTSDPSGPDTMVIYLTTADPHVKTDFVIHSGLADNAVVFRQVPYSEAQLNALDTQIRTDYDALRSEGFPIGRWGIAEDRSGVEVEISDATSEQFQSLKERYGPGLIMVADPDPSEILSFVLPLVDGKLPAR